LLEARLGAATARRRLAMETSHAVRVFGGGINFFHPENWYSLAKLIRFALRAVGLYRRAQRNALDIRIRYNDVTLARLPAAFDGYTLLHLSDLHVDMSDAIVPRLIETVAALEYDACVLTGDYRAATSGPIEPALDGMRRLCAVLRRPLYGVLGNHDSISMLPALESIGIRFLMNESVRIEREGAALVLAGVDDPHYFRADDLERACAGSASVTTSILLSHTPEIYRRAAAAGFDLMLCGHTHGGQICLPGGIPITLDADLPRRFGRAAWRYDRLQGYTSVGCGTSIVDVRINCPPEITLHRLRCAELP
jgi:predicted MPP superfamily phosphohydrolase